MRQFFKKYSCIRFSAIFLLDHLYDLTSRVFIIQRTSFHDFLEIVTDGSFMEFVEFNLTTIIINEYFTWQWVMGSRICKGILVMFVQGQLAGAVSARMDCRYSAVGIGNCQWANIMGSVQIEYKQYQQIGGNIYCEIQKIYQDPKTLFFIYLC